MGRTGRHSLSAPPGASERPGWHSLGTGSILCPQGTLYDPPELFQGARRMAAAARLSLLLLLGCVGLLRPVGECHLGGQLLL